MKIRRDIASIPVRSAADTWRAIIALVTGKESVDRQQLENASSIMESLIADELPATVPIVFKGAGPRLVIYCLYHEDAMEHGLDIDSLNTNPTGGNWYVTVHCEHDDTIWMNKSLKSKAPRITVHDLNEVPGEQNKGDKPDRSEAFEIDWDALK